MSYVARELDFLLSGQAADVMRTKSKLKGPRYLRSGLRKGLDKIVAGPAFLSVSPLIMLAALAVFAQDRHNPFVDVGSNNPATGEYVPVFKLRSMDVNARDREQEVIGDLPVCAFKNKFTDPRITPLGRYIRRISLDETPQLLSVLNGRLTLIGPRILSTTERKNFLEPYSSSPPYSQFIDLLSQGMRFGITGLFAVLRRTGPIEERMGLDVIYGSGANLEADLRIIAMTFPALFRGK